MARSRNIAIDDHVKDVMDSLPPLLRIRMEEHLKRGELVVLSRYEWASLLSAAKSALPEIAEPSLKKSLSDAIDSAKEQLRIGKEAPAALGGPAACIR